MLIWETVIWDLLTRASTPTSRATAAIVTFASSIPDASRIASAAAVSCGPRGAVSRLAAERGVHRQVVYRAAHEYPGGAIRLNPPKCVSTGKCIAKLAVVQSAALQAPWCRWVAP